MDEQKKDPSCSTPSDSSLHDAGSDCTPPIPGARAPSGPNDPEATVNTGPESEPIGPEETGGRCRYVWTRPHARGGIGQVWLAYDTNLEREVALKELLPESTYNPPVRARFMAEARITGQLAHPGVVPVYEVGRQPDDGRLFYAMQFVRGQTFTESIREYHRKRAAGMARPLDLLALVNAFVAVCNTVAFAHSRGVIHRDLKGVNVLLGDYGEVFLLDWGLAKRVTDPAEEAALPAGSPSHPHATTEGQVLGTPAYMAPEQAQGELSVIDQRTDVYGLGAMLYEILAGRPPYSGKDTDEVLRQVREREPTPPRQVNASVPPPLEAVCKKAMARTKEQRYASAGDLAREVQRWLADEPVEAYPEPLIARLRRWGRRHRPLVAGAAALLITAVVGLAISTVLISQEQTRTETARQKAEKNFRLARDAVDRFYTRVSKEQLLNQPRMQNLRQDLMREARDYYKQFVAERQDDPDLQAELGRAYLQLAKITSAIGSKPESIELLHQGRAIADKLAQRDPSAADPQQLLTELYNNEALQYIMLRQFDKAEEMIQSAIATGEALLKRFPGVDAYRAYLGLCYNNLAVVRRDRKEAGPADEPLRKAIDLLTPLAERPQPDDQAASDLAGSWDNIGMLSANKEQYEEAQKAFKNALDLRQGLVQRHPEDLDYRNRLAGSYNNLGTLYRMVGTPQKARDSLKEGLAIRKKLADENPSVVPYQDQLANIYLNLGNLSRAEQQLRQARDEYDKALKIWSRLARDHPEEPFFQESVGWAYYHLAGAQAEDGQLAAALDSYNQAVQALEATPARRQQSEEMLREARRLRDEVRAKLRQMKQ
jgi:eukaryotic-like serine/threonine-protein kinase